jgi:hypothetical protein
MGHNIESVRGGLYNIRRFNQILERKDIILGDIYQQEVVILIIMKFIKDIILVEVLQLMPKN